MPAFKWVIDYKDYEKQRLDRPSVQAVRKYLGGFGYNKINRRPMFQDELNDLEIVYKTALKNYAKEVEDVLPPLLHYMEQFLTLHKQNEAIREKLDVLLAKTGRDQDGGDDE
jgi:hypothetical protein